MDDLKLLIAHSEVLSHENLDNLKTSNVLDEFRYVSLDRIYQGKEKFVPFNKLINTLNLFFKYKVDLYDKLLDFLYDNYIVKLNHNGVTSKETLSPVMTDIHKKIGSEGLSKYLFTGDTRQLQPFDIFRSVELLSTSIEHFQIKDFTSPVVSKGLSFLNTKESMRKMFTHLASYPFNVVYEDLVKASIDRDNVVFLDYLITEHENRKDINTIMFDGYNCALYSSSKGSLNCLKYSYEHGGSEIWNGRICMEAAKNGHMDCLQYARNHGLDC